MFTIVIHRNDIYCITFSFFTSIGMIQPLLFYKYWNDTTIIVLQVLE